MLSRLGHKYVYNKVKPLRHSITESLNLSSDLHLSDSEAEKTTTHNWND